MIGWKAREKIKMPCLIEHAKKTSASLPNWIHSEQQLAEKRIKSIPFPNSKQEYWKYLPIEKLREINFNSVKDTISPDLLVSRYQSLIKNKSHKIFLSNGTRINHYQQGGYQQQLLQWLQSAGPRGYGIVWRSMLSMSTNLAGFTSHRKTRRSRSQNNHCAVPMKE